MLVRIQMKGGKKHAPPKTMEATGAASIVQNLDYLVLRVPTDLGFAQVTLTKAERKALASWLVENYQD